MRTLALLLGFAAAVAAQDGETSSGLKYVVVKAGTGTRPVPGEIVRIRYTARDADGGTLLTGHAGDAPFRFVLGRRRVARALDEGVELMDVGSTFRFEAPARLAGTDRPVTYEVELLGIVTPPEFRRADPARQKTTPSGLKVEVLKEGDGEVPGRNQAVELRYARWTPDGMLMECTEVGRTLHGAVHSFPWRFLPEALGMMKPGTVLRLEVPPQLGYVGEDAAAVWELELLKAEDLPAMPAAEPARQRKTAGGVVMETMKKGQGPAPAAEGWVTVHYTGWLESGLLFDSSHGRGEPSVFRLKSALPGWREALLQMKEGEVCRLTIPPALAYGNQRQGVIPPGSTLIVVLELVKAGR